MGWNSGGTILESVALALEQEFGITMPGAQTTILAKLIHELEVNDADTLDESFDTTPALDAALVSKGYHHWKDSCEELDDYDACSCGWKNRWS